MTVDADFRLLQKELNAIREELRTLRRGALPSVGAGETVIQNEAKLYFSGLNGLGQSGYIYMSAGNDFVVGNFADGEKIILNVRNGAGTQRSLELIVDAGTTVPQLTGQDGLRLVASGTSADILLDASGNITLDANGAIMIVGLPTSDPHVVNQVWKSGTTLMISAG